MKKNEICLPADNPTRIFLGIAACFLIFIMLDNYRHYTTLPSLELVLILICTLLIAGLSRTLFIKDSATYMSINFFGTCFFNKKMSDYRIECYEVSPNKFSSAELVLLLDAKGNEVFSTKWMNKKSALFFTLKLNVLGIQEKAITAE